MEYMISIVQVEWHQRSTHHFIFLVFISGQIIQKNPESHQCRSLDHACWKQPQKTNMLNPKMKIWKKFSPFLMGIVYFQVPPIRFRGGVCCLICLIQVRIDHQSPRYPRILRRLEDFRPHQNELERSKDIIHLNMQPPKYHL